MFLFLPRFKREFATNVAPEMEEEEEEEEEESVEKLLQQQKKERKNVVILRGTTTKPRWTIVVKTARSRKPMTKKRAMTTTKMQVNPKIFPMYRVLFDFIPLPTF